ncbi:glycerophosphodiester phosphodiesterase family protein [uncultured Maritalea sp.]|uniref:glycerophosphodiester phosphodiesterase family protein n=1 Tax=uncultured Maritalea sp. TaxID=757249 RepID=UPI00260F51B6|nr:glycerophosphodiester phosphodiesterase family protein [uncultured Maritalea sp.]
MDDIAAAFAQPIAHRGLHNHKKGIIENSADAFAAAINAGLAIECDLQLTGDDQPVVFHDYTLDRLTAQSGRLRSISADQFSRIPLKGSQNKPQSFADLLQQVDGQVPLIVELKSQHDDNSQLAKHTVEVAQNYEGPLVFKSFDPKLLVDLRRHACPWPIGVVLEREKPKNAPWIVGFLLRHLLHWPWTRFSFVSCNVDDLDLPMVRLCRTLGYKVMTWTVKNEAQHANAAIYADQVVFEDEGLSQLDKGKK